nr:hypothetical protein [Chloroflexota bacterium]
MADPRGAGPSDGVEPLPPRAVRFFALELDRARQDIATGVMVRPVQNEHIAAAIVTLLVGGVFVAIVVRGTALPPDRGEVSATVDVASPSASAAVVATDSSAPTFGSSEAVANSPRTAVSSPQSTPPTELPLEAVVEKAGIQLRIVLDRNPMPAGQPTWATTEVRNTGTRDLHWITDGCETHVGISAELQGVTWDPGTATDGPLAEYRDWFIESANLTEGSIWFSFAKPAHVGMVRG